jgi:hypothetical protein
MANTMRLIRVIGLIVASIGAWYNIWLLVLAGLLMILLAWLRGKILLTKAIHQLSVPDSEFKRANTN